MNLVWSPFTDALFFEKTLIGIISPFCSMSAAEKVIQTASIPKFILTKWSLADMLANTNTIELFNYTQRNGIKLYIHPTLHAKLYICTNEEIFCTSGNLTDKGLGLSDPYNFELGVWATLTPIDSIKLQEHLDRSILVTQALYEEFKDALATLTPIGITQDLYALTYAILAKHKGLQSKARHVLTALPECESKEEYINGNANSYAVLHDANLVGTNNIEENFIKLPLISELIEELKKRKSMGFGEVTSFIQDRLEDVPRPYRSDIKDKVRKIYNWLQSCTQECSWNIPGKHSQVLYWQTNLP